MKSSKEVFCQVLEQLGKEWEVHPVSYVRNELDRLEVMLGVNKLVANGETDPKILNDCSPTFCSLYQRVMLRQIEEEIASGDDE